MSDMIDYYEEVLLLRKKVEKYETLLTGVNEMTTFDFGNGLVPAHQHPNGGGWVADTATVSKTAYVRPDARVYGDAWVYDDA